VLQYPEMIIHSRRICIRATPDSRFRLRSRSRRCLAVILARSGSLDAQVDDDRVVLQTVGNFARRSLAYAVLGWGGYWAGIPLKNASFLPWADRNGVSALRDDAGKARHDEGVERMAGIHHVHAVHSRNVAHTKRRGQFGPRVCTVQYWKLVCSDFFRSYSRPAFYAYFKNRDYLKSENQLDSMFPRVELLVQITSYCFVACIAICLGSFSRFFRMVHGLDASASARRSLTK